MQVSTNRFYDRSAAAMAGLQERADTLGAQISTGKKLGLPSDDSVAYQRLSGLARAKADDTAYGANLTLATSLLQQTDTALSQIADQMQRASELAIQAGSDTMTATGRAAIGVQLAGIVDTLAGLANAKDARGQPLLGGADGGAAVTRTVTGYSYASSATSPIPIADGQSVQPGETAARVFRIGGRDALSILAALAATLQSGASSGEDARAAIDDLSTATDQVTAMQASVGARAARVDMIAAQAKDVATDREATRSGLEDTDVTQAITDLQKTMTILQATQASFSKLSSLSLFDYLR